jgi:hypothetical protein
MPDAPFPTCGTGIVKACDFPQFFVDQTPKFDELIMEDIRPTDGWLLNVSTGTVPMGTPVEITQDRFRSVWPNTTKTWQRVVANGPGCAGHPCDPPEHCIGWGADRLTYYAEQQTWATPLLCYDQDMHITHAEQHIAQIISEILRPATTAISSNFLRKRALQWAHRRNTANRNLDQFTYVWTLAGPNGDEEAFFDCSVPPNNVFMLAPQMLQNRFAPLMRQGYAGKNPFKETSPFIELVTDMDTCWNLEHLSGSQGIPAGSAIGGWIQTPNVMSNFRFTDFSEADKYWRYGFSGQIGNFLVRVDEMGLRFNYVTDRGAAAAPNRYRYQVVLPYVNNITTGAGGSAGIGSEPNPDYERAQYSISYIWHKKAMELLIPDARPLNPDMPFGHRDFGGKWRFAMHDLGSDIDGHTIANKWENKGQFIAWFKYYVRPLHYEFAEVFFHKREQFCIPEIVTCNASPGYPAQNYDSCLPTCPLPATWPYEIEPLSASGDEAITPPAAGLGAPLVDTPMTFPPGVVGASGTGNPPDQ